MLGAIIPNGLYSGYAFRNNSQPKDEKNEAKQALIDKNYNEIYAHELAHKAAGGHLAGAIVIEKNSEGIPVGGHVAIKMPSLNPNNPKQTINDADTVIRSAMAPADPSGQDYKVAAQARTIKAEAQELQNKPKLNLIA